MTSVYTVRAPFAGRVRPVSDVPDPVFADGLMGPGPALEPTPGATVEVCAPVDGRIVALKPHALVITPPGAPEKVGVLVHLGIDTVTLRGEGFAVHVAPQDEVRAGDRLITWDTTVAAARGLSTLCPVAVLAVEPDALERVVADGADVAAGDPLATLTVD